MVQSGRWWVRAHAAVLTLAMVAASAGAQDAALRSYNAGNGFLQRGMHELAVPEYEAFLKAQPEHEHAATARYGLGVCLFQLGDDERAIQELTQVARIEGFAFAPDAELLLGHSRLRRQEYDAAAMRFARVVEDFPEHRSAADAGALLIESQYRGEQYRAAIDAAKLVTERWPSHSLRDRSDFFWGLSEEAIGEFAGAAQRFAAIVERGEPGPIFEQAGLLLARNLARSDQPGEAIGRYRAVVQAGVEAYLPEALYGLARLLRDSGGGEEAEVLLRRLIDQHEGSPMRAGAWHELGRLMFDTDRFADARAAFAASAQGDADKFAATGEYWTAKCWLREGDPQQAATTLTGALERYPESQVVPETRYDLGVALFRAGQLEAAAGAFDQYLEYHAGHTLAPNAIYSLALVHHQAEQHERSLEHAEAFLALQPDHELAADASFLRAESLYLLGRLEDAGGAYTAFLEAHSDHPQAGSARYRLGMSLHRRAKFADAQQVLTQVVANEHVPTEFRQAWLALGDGAFQQGHWQAAVEALTTYQGFGAEAPGADDASLKLGLALARLERHQDASTAFTALLDNHPDSQHAAQAIFERGQTRIALQQFDPASADFLRVVGEHSGSRFAPHAMRFLGDASGRTGDWSAAAGWYAKAAEHGDAELAEQSSFEQGRALLAGGQAAEAVVALDRLIASATDQSLVGRGRATRAIALSRAGQPEQAVLAAESLADADLSAVDDATLHAVGYEHAWSLRRLERIDAAEESFRALLGEPISVDLRSHAVLEVVSIEMGREDWQAAAESLDGLAATLETEKHTLTPSLAEQFAYRRGACALRLNDHATAIESLDSFHERFPDSDLLVSAELMVAEALVQTGRSADAVGHLQRVIETGQPDSLGSALLRLGEAATTLSRWPDAESAFARYLETQPDSELLFQARFGLGWAKENQGRLDDAMAEYRQVVDKHEGPTSARAQFQIGECLFAQNKHEAAIPELLKVDILYAYPEWSAAAVYETARCYEELGRFAEARAQHRQVIERFGDSQWAALSTGRLEQLAAVSVPRGQSSDSNGGGDTP